MTDTTRSGFLLFGYTLTTLAEVSLTLAKI
jgi:hypothetical protein